MYAHIAMQDSNGRDEPAMDYLVFLTAMVLILCSAGMLSVAIGARAWLLGAIGALCFAAWFSKVAGIAPLVVGLGLFFLAPAGFTAAVAISLTIGNRKLPPDQRRTFGPAMKAALKAVLR
ncbi:hypothetical protein [Poseidonocella sp. HB161398]|uniref:hypothetical protein n=1 Tax=Poseidonocella sp. HB161398 TaxID=2320855 RepID=UPI001109D9BD|nr:hypothetical protein [Poseidonocella sp. HB161398]